MADDLTGALEVGAIFAAAGADSVVFTRALTRPSDQIPADVVVVDTETRHLSAADAAARVAQWVRTFGQPPGLIYKKTDSTLRGNIQAELTALCRLYPNSRIGYAPAYPAQGRTVIDGLVYVNGIALTETPSARDALNPVSTSSIYELLGSALPYTVFDGVTQKDVLEAAVAIVGDPVMRIAAGPSALAAALAKLLPFSRQAAGLPNVQSCLVLNGSRTDLSASQFDKAKRRGCIGTTADALWRWTDVGVPDGAVPADVAAQRADHLIDLLRSTDYDAVFLVGGDTAYAFIAALGHPPLRPIAELLSGVALCRIPAEDTHKRLPMRGRDLMLITKAGGFGDIDVVCDARRILEQNAG